MAAKKVNRTYNNTYIDGNTARKVEQQQAPERKVREPKRRRNISHTVRKNQEKALYMDLPYVITLTVAAVCTLGICVNYLHVQSSITSRIHSIEQKEKKLEELKAENDGLETRINTYVDLDYVYKVATEELGMVYANKDQVLLYNKTESEYVRQYEDIPKHE